MKKIVSICLIGTMSLFASNLILNGGFEKNGPVTGWLTFSLIVIN